MSEQRVFQIRMPTELLSRARALVEWSKTQPDIAPTGKSSVSGVLRFAMRIGLSRLEKRMQRDQDDD